MSTATDATIHSAVTCPYSGCKRRRIPKSMIYVYDIIYMCVYVTRIPKSMIYVYDIIYMCMIYVYDIIYMCMNIYIIYKV